MLISCSPRSGLGADDGEVWLVPESLPFGTDALETLPLGPVEELPVQVALSLKNEQNKAAFPPVEDLTEKIPPSQPRPPSPLKDVEPKKQEIKADGKEPPAPVP